jgi:type VI secretion system secreted protein Hcp
MAQVDYFLKVDGVPGESQDGKHPNEIQIESFSFGATQGGSMGRDTGGGSGKVQLQDFHFVMKANKASPKLFEACATGQHIGNAILTCRKAGGEQEEFLKYTFSDLLVSSFQTGGSGGSDVIPIDQISLNFTKIEIEYKEQTAKGSVTGQVKGGWDQKKNAKV